MPTKVFISYSHDGEPHETRVRELANALIDNGLHVELDQFETLPPRGWAFWCADKMKPGNADFVLMICTADYYAGVENEADPDKRRGVFWEAQLIRNYIYEAKANERFLPVLFDDAPAAHVPDALRPYRKFRLRGFSFDDPGYEDLYRILTQQPAIVRPPPGKVVKLPPKSPVRRETPPPAAPFDLGRIYNYAPTQLIGRDQETALIEQAWSGGAARVLAFVALGGEGKTSLVASWANGLAARNWPGCEMALAWSFYRQGASEQAGASSDLFFVEALKAFGLEIIERESGYEKGKRLAGRLATKRALLILDGLEPLQYPLGSPLAGRLKDDALSALLRALANRNAGLCLVTTRYAVEDLAGLPATVTQHELGGLSEQAGARLLTTLGVKGGDKDMRQLSADVAGHPLTLEIIGSYLKKAHGGDIARRDRIKLETADKAKGGHAMRAMQEYARWLEGADDKGARALALLRLTGLFDRPANAACLEALWAAPPIPGLTEPLVDLDEDERNLALSDLDAGKLLTVKREGAALTEIDAHPLLRAYFAKALREDRPEAGREAHRRLYAHLTKTPDKEKPTLDDLQPLYQAVAHGCAAGLWQETCDEVYLKRICRGAEAYSTKKLGAYGADLGAVAGFFDAPWRRVSPQLTAPDQAGLLNVAGFCLRGLGRLGEAREPLQAGLEMQVAQENWKDAAIAAGNLSELALTLGQIAEAIRLGETAVSYADRSGDAFQRLAMRTTEADARHQAGQRAEAEALFVEAERRQAEAQPQYPQIYSLWGYRDGDWRLALAERAVWQRLLAKARAPGPVAADEALAACAEAAERATQTLAWAIANNVSLLDIGLDHLTLARAALYAAALRGEPPTGEHVQDGVDFLRRGGGLHNLPWPLLTRAVYRALVADFPGAQDDLDEAYEIAQRGPMKLHLADIHLHRARMFGLIARRPPDYPWQSPQADLDSARALIDSCGYNRRRPELEDAEAALRARG